MSLFRNPEIQKSLFVQIGAAVLFSVIGIFTPNALLIVLICTTFLCLNLLQTWLRYRRIRQLSQELDQVLHGADTLSFADYKEGELSILKIEIDKMLLRLREQSDALKQEKLSLASSMADISHQIRTPLTSIRLILSLLSETELPKERRISLVRQLSALISRIDWLIEALLKLSRLDAGTVVLKPESIPVKDIVLAAAEPIAIPMELREQQFQFTQKAEPSSPQSLQPATVWCDYSWTVEAVANLLKNCMEHTPPGGQITAIVSDNAIFTELVIEDNGPGFAGKDLPHIFERFYKGENSGEQSIGIGLALARMIFSAQNATIKAQNRPEGGARFIIHFYKS